MKASTNHRSLVRANQAFRDKDYKTAATLYERILNEADEVLKPSIRLNLDLVRRRMGMPLGLPKIGMEKPKGLDDFYFNLIKAGSFFDSPWYLDQYKFKYQIVGNPLAHYLEHGVALSTNPSPNFDTAYYIKTHQDVAADMHPFLHYVCIGHKEGRSAKPSALDVNLDHYPVEAPRYVSRLSLDAPPLEKAARVIAFYLPQFHPIPENDAWWGKGFTDWSNVKLAKPQFAGHYQPHVPDDLLGYYDLRDTAVMRKQIELAKQYGIEGFCFYTYWFTGKRLLESPVDNYLADPTLDLHFCICWANENWSRRWDGLDHDLLMEQHYSPEDDVAFIAHMSKYLRDPRYIRVDGKPLLVVYRPNLLPSMQNTALRWRDWCRNNELGEIYIAYVQSFEKCDPEDYGLDAAIEFPPNQSSPPDITERVNRQTTYFSGQVYDWRVFPKRSEKYDQPTYRVFRSACPSWDNTSRKGGNGKVFANSSPMLFEKWLTNAFLDTLHRYPNPSEQIVFINAWNEWAEGAHLEPDREYGYSWLAALRQAHQNALFVQMNKLKDKTLLFVDYALPMYDRFAGSRTNYMYLQLFLRMGMKVFYLPADFKHVEPYSTELKNLGVEVLAGDSFRKSWKEWFKGNGAKIDYALLNKPNPAIQFLEAILNHTQAPIIYQCHDLHYLRLQRQAELTDDLILLDEANFFREKENYLFSVCDVLLTFSSFEAEIIKRGFPQKPVHTVPLFFYEDTAKPRYDFFNRSGLLYVGGFDHTPNRDAVLWFCQEILPLVLQWVPNIVFNVVGANPPAEIVALNSANIKIHGKVSEEGLKTLYESVRLSVVPLRVGAGVKGKVIEALAHAIPLVATSIGLEGITGVSQAVSPKDDPELFAAEILALHTDEDLWNKRSMSCAAFVAEHFTTQKTAELTREILSAAKATVEERCKAATSSLEQNPLRTIAFHLPQYHPIPENDEWWGRGFTEWRNVCSAKPLFAGHYQPHIPADLGFYDLRLEEARIAQADLAGAYSINGFCYYHYWFNGRRLLERPLEELLASGKPDFPFCLCWANENWTRRWDGQDSQILMKQTYSEADDRSHIQDLFRFFRDPRYIRVNGKPLFLVYRTENMPNPLRTADIWREEANKAGIGELYLVRVESIGQINPLEIGFDAALEFTPDWNRMGNLTSVYQSDDSELSEVVEVPKVVYENNYTRSYVELMNNMLAKDQPSYPWFRCVTPSFDNSARRSENAVILLNSTPRLYQQWLEKIINKTIYSNRADERIVFVNAWNEWAEGNHLEPCQKWGRSYLEATKSGVQNGLKLTSVSGSPRLSIPAFTPEVGCKESSPELAESLLKLVAEEQSPGVLLISFENFSDLGEFTYLKGWAVIDDGLGTRGDDIQILVHKPGSRARLIIPAKRNRPDVTSHFGNKFNYDYSGFEVMTRRIDLYSSITVVIKRNSMNYWQEWRGYDG